MTARSNAFRKFAPGAMVLAGLGIGLVMSPMLTAQRAAADPPRQTDPTKTIPFNSGAQRDEQTAALKEMNQRLERIEAKLNAPLSVKVTEMPPVVMKEAAK